MSNGSHVESPVTFGVLQPAATPPSFLNFCVPVFWGRPLTLDLSDVSSRLHSGCTSSAGVSRKPCQALLTLSHQAAHSLICPVTPGVHSDPWLKVVSARWLRCKASPSCFVITAYSLRMYFKCCNMLSIVHFCFLVSVGTPGFLVTGWMTLRHLHCPL